MTNKVILITGASRGIGKSVANMLAKHHQVYAVSRSVEDGQDGNLTYIRFDLSGDLGSLEKLLADRGVNRIDVLINNAGALINKEFEKISEQELTYIYKVNVFTPFLLTQAMLPRLENAEHPHVVNIGSVGGVNATSKFPGLSAYSSSKGALGILSECLAEELKDRVSVNCLALGAVQTEMLSEAFPGYQAPLQPDQIAEYISQFALTGHYYQNGKTICVSLSNP